MSKRREQTPISDFLYGRRFGKLRVLNLDSKIGRRLYWLCKCDCGRMQICSQADLRSGEKTRCGICEYEGVVVL